MLRLLLVALVLAAANAASAGPYCEVNEYDQPHVCSCPFGTAVSSMKSTHDNDHEDRRWEVDCRTGVSYGVHYIYTTETTDFDQNFIFEFYDDDNHLGFLSGITSVHDNHYEDRIFTFTYTIPEGFTIQLSLCRWEKINTFDQPMNLVLSENEVINGIESVNSNHNEDREFTVKVCIIKPNA